MAVEGDNPVEIKAHAESYSRFAWMMKWGTIASAVVAAIVVVIISS